MYVPVVPLYDPAGQAVQLVAPARNKHEVRKVALVCGTSLTKVAYKTQEWSDGKQEQTVHDLSSAPAQ